LAFFGTLDPDDAEALAGRRLQRTELLQARRFGRDVVGLDVDVDATLVVDARWICTIGSSRGVSLWRQARGRRGSRTASPANPLNSHRRIPSLSSNAKSPRVEDRIDALVVTTKAGEAAEKSPIDAVSAGRP
jgi:hypothetical protein